MKLIDLTGMRFGRLVVHMRAENIDQQAAWQCFCDCGKTIYVIGTYLKSGDVQSCGCLKFEQDHINLRERYDAKRVAGIARHLFTNKARVTSATGYRGVSQYRTRVSKEIRYRANITVAGKTYYKSGFLTVEDAYRARLELERTHLPKPL